MAQRQQAGPGAASSAPRLDVDGTRFTLDGAPRFLLGISYYAALGAPDDVLQRDLDEIRRLGFSWLRVWATWGAFEHDVSAVNTDGNAREPFLGRLDALVAACGERGLVVDVTLSRGNGVTGPPRLQSLAAHRRAVEAILGRLAPRPNWYLDLGNERNLRDRRHVPFDDLRALRYLVRESDPARLVTASHASVDLTRDDVREYLETVGVDLLAPHRPRRAGSAGETAARTREVLAWAEDVGRPVPVHYQEPFRRGFGRYEPRAEDFIADLKGAWESGAAGWCFHNGDTRGAPDGRPRRSFDLRDGSLFDQFDAEEHAVLHHIEGTAW